MLWWIVHRLQLLRLGGCKSLLWAIKLILPPLPPLLYSKTCVLSVCPLFYFFGTFLAISNIDMNILWSYFLWEFPIFRIPVSKFIVSYFLSVSYNLTPWPGVKIQWASSWKHWFAHTVSAVVPLGGVTKVINWSSHTAQEVLVIQCIFTLTLCNFFW